MIIYFVFCLEVECSAKKSSPLNFMRYEFSTNTSEMNGDFGAKYMFGPMKN
jgi:hypothetical protein